MKHNVTALVHEPNCQFPICHLSVTYIDMCQTICWFMRKLYYESELVLQVWLFCPWYVDGRYVFLQNVDVMNDYLHYKGSQLHTFVVNFYTISSFLLKQQWFKKTLQSVTFSSVKSVVISVKVKSVFTQFWVKTIPEMLQLFWSYFNTLEGGTNVIWNSFKMNSLTVSFTL